MMQPSTPTLEKTDISRTIDPAALPEPGSVWRHKGGTLYTVLDVTSSPDEAKKDEFPVTVIYIGPDGRKWPRTLKRWYDSMTLVAAAEFTPGTLFSLVNLALIAWRAKRNAVKAAKG